MIHRNFLLQTADYYFVGEAFRRLKSQRKWNPVSQAHREYAWRVVQRVLSELGGASLFRLHKTLFLIDLKAVETSGRSITGFFYLRQKDGPYCVELGGGWHRQFPDQIQFIQRDGKPFLKWKPAGLFDQAPALDEGHLELVDSVVTSVGQISDEQLKARAYLTKPMRSILALERAGKPQLNRPLLK